MRHIVRVQLLLLALILGAAAPTAAQSPSTPGSPAPIGAESVVIVQLTGADGAALAPGDQAAATAVVEARLAALPAPGTTITALLEDRLRIELGDPTQLDAVRRLATAPGVLTFVPIPEGVEVVEGTPLPDGVDATPLVSNAGIVSVTSAQDSMGAPALDVRLTPDGASALDAWAADHIGQRLAIVLDDNVVVAPAIHASSFGGELQVSGPLDRGTVAELAAIISGGVLPVAAEALIVCPAVVECPIPSPATRTTTTP